MNDSDSKELGTNDFYYQLKRHLLERKHICRREKEHHKKKLNKSTYCRAIPAPETAVGE